MTRARVLVVNADDFGQSTGVNRGVIRAHEHGIVTSTSLMVRWPATAQAVRYAISRPQLSVGLHLDLGEWEYGTDKWRARYEVVALDDRRAVRDELERQLDAFHELMGRAPSHLDSHQHVHRSEPVRGLLISVGEHLGVPVRGLTYGVAYCGAFYGQSDRGHSLPELITVDALVAIIERLAPGITELGCHPGEDDLESTYGRERVIELETLCDPHIRAALDEAGVQLSSFSELSNVIG